MHCPCGGHVVEGWAGVDGVGGVFGCGRLTAGSSGGGSRSAENPGGFAGGWLAAGGDVRWRVPVVWVCLPSGRLGVLGVVGICELHMRRG